MAGSGDGDSGAVAAGGWSRVAATSAEGELDGSFRQSSLGIEEFAFLES